MRNATVDMSGKRTMMRTTKVLTDERVAMTKKDKVVSPDELRETVERLGETLLQELSAEELSDPRLCALSAGLCAVYLMIVSQAGPEERAAFYKTLQSEEETMRVWANERTMPGLDGLDIDTETVH